MERSVRILRLLTDYMLAVVLSEEIPRLGEGLGDPFKRGETVYVVLCKFINLRAGKFDWLKEDRALGKILCTT